MPMRSLDDFAYSKLAELERASLRRTLAETLREDGPCEPFKTVIELPQWRRQWILWRATRRWS
jgi:phytoene/squalene synthetase